MSKRTDLRILAELPLALFANNQGYGSYHQEACVSPK